MQRSSRFFLVRLSKIVKATEKAKPQGDCEYSSYSDSCVSYDNDEEDWAAAKDAVDAGK